MTRSSHLPLLQVPGLQIFSKLKSNDDEGFMSPSPTLDRDTLLGTSEGTRHEFYSTWRKPSQLSSQSVLNEYSPTIIDRNFSPMSAQASTKHMNWDVIISKIFLQQPFGIVYRFFEEFEYSIITSHFLNDLNHYRSLLYPNQSITNFHKSSAILKAVPLNSSAFVATKYGKLSVVENKKIFINQTFNYLSTILTSYRVFRQLKKYCKEKNNLGVKRIVSSILIVVYLSIQQEYFRSHLICYKTLIEIQKVLKSLQQLDVMIHKYHLRYKEIKNHKVISRVTFMSNAEEYLSMIEELLTLSSDALFYKLKLIIDDIVILSDTSELSKYCELYGVDISNLYYNTTTTIKDLDGKLCRLKILKKFMLCCLLSLDIKGNNKFSNLSMQNALTKIFPDYMARLQYRKTTNSIDTFQNVTRLLKKLHPLLSSVLMSLNDHKYILYALPEELLPIDEGERRNTCPYSEGDEVFRTLHYLKTVENNLLSIDIRNGITENDKKVVQSKLEELLAFWKTSNPSSDNFKTKKTPVASTICRGFHLDIFKGRKSCSSLSVQKLNLERKVEFIDVTESENESSENENESENIEEYDSVAEYYKTGIDETYREGINGALDNTKADFKQLSDNELRRKLDERIYKLARENREGRERLRTAKSFELLRNTQASFQTKFGLQNQSRKNAFLESGPLNKCKVSSEETIPFLYELEGLLGKGN
ncbi:YMR163C [Saccharomyces arboricola H-6]|uniref:Inheritance of peroxisomes protein 2 n=1 Tax=Saccharomyces arboricola (strain H-6 / AS 2.3317 / CBS 10644) TaxID=1160507 RepID=J8LQ36_SACAR|nr:YMR163C [Saccharomyces arboricola H-6]